MKQLFYKMAKGFAAMVMQYGRHSVGNACQGPYCQPKVPESMRKGGL